MFFSSNGKCFSGVYFEDKYSNTLEELGQDKDGLSKGKRDARADVDCNDRIIGIRGKRKSESCNNWVNF